MFGGKNMSTFPGPLGPIILALRWPWKKVISKMYEWSGGRWGIQAAKPSRNLEILRPATRNRKRNPWNGRLLCFLFRPTSFMGSDSVKLFSFFLCQLNHVGLIGGCPNPGSRGKIIISKGSKGTSYWPSLSTVNQCLGRLHGAFGMYHIIRLYVNTYLVILDKPKL